MSLSSLPTPLSALRSSRRPARVAVPARLTPVMPLPPMRPAVVDLDTPPAVVLDLMRAQDARNADRLIGVLEDVRTAQRRQAASLLVVRRCAVAIIVLLALIALLLVLA